MRKIIRIITVCAWVIYTIYAVYYIVATPVKKEYEDCGIVRSKSADEIIIKHGSRTELYLNVDFKNSGFQAVRVTPTTYFGTQKGKRVCFDLPVSQTEGEALWDIVTIIYASIVIVVAALLAIVFFIDYTFFNSYLFTKSKD